MVELQAIPCLISASTACQGTGIPFLQTLFLLRRALKFFLHYTNQFRVSKRATNDTMIVMKVFGLSDNCYYAPGQVAHDDYVPCHDDPRRCCMKGDGCVQDIPVCWNKDSGITYVASCTDSTYTGPKCGGQMCNKGKLRSAAQRL